MGFMFEAVSRAADAPSIEGGMYDARCLGITPEHIEQFVGTNKFGKSDSGDRWRWEFVLLDDEGQALQDVDEEGNVKYRDGDPIEIEVSGLTNTGLNFTSKTVSRQVRYLRAVAPGVAAAVEAGQPADPSAIEGAPCQVEVRIKDNGWPEVVNVLPPRTRRAARRRATTEDEE